MSVKFTGFSGLQTPYQQSLLVGQSTWTVSLFFWLDSSSATDSEVMDWSYLLKGHPKVIPTNSVGSDYVFGVQLLKAYDPSLVTVYASAVASGELAGTLSPPVDAFRKHHLLFFPVPASPPSQGNIDLYLDGSKDGQVINEYYDGTIESPGDYAVRLGNINVLQAYPGWSSQPRPPGEVSFKLENVAIWHGWTPTAADITALRDRSSTPDEVGTGLVAWWPLEGPSGQAVTGTVINEAHSGTYDLSIV